VGDGEPARQPGGVVVRGVRLGDDAAVAHDEAVGAVGERGRGAGAGAVRRVCGHCRAGVAGERGGQGSGAGGGGGHGGSMPGGARAGVRTGRCRRSSPAAPASCRPPHPRPHGVSWADVPARTALPGLGPLLSAPASRPRTTPVWPLSPTRRRRGGAGPPGEGPSASPPAGGDGPRGAAGTRRRRPSVPACGPGDRKSTRLNSSHVKISYAV